VVYITDRHVHINEGGVLDENHVKGPETIREYSHGQCMLGNLIS